MINKHSMYNGDEDGDKKPEPKAETNKIDIKDNVVVVESGGKTIRVVSEDQYNRLLSDYEKTKKQLRNMTIEFQRMKRYVNGLAKTISEIPRNPFQR